MALTTLRMDAIPPLAPEELTLWIKDYPLSARAHEKICVSARIANDSRHNLISFPPHPVNISYQWRNAHDNAFVVFDGIRTPLRPFLLSHSTQEYKLLVECPPMPGKYILKVTLVQEGVRWIDDHSAFLRDQITLEVR